MTETITVQSFSSPAPAAQSRRRLSPRSRPACSQDLRRRADISGLAASPPSGADQDGCYQRRGRRQGAALATDVTLLINNAGVNHNTSFMTAPDLR